MLNDPGELNLKGENRNVTMLHSDIHGFTAISETLTPEILGELLNSYLGTMTEILLRNNGMLDKYIFNSVVGIFNAPLNHPDHPHEAARTAIAMQNAMDELNVRYKEEYKLTLQIGIGLHTGSVIIGNFGSPRRFNYTAVGKSVSIASQLERLTKTWGVGIIISESMRQELGDEFPVRRLDSVWIEGMSQPVVIFELITTGSADEKRVLADRFGEALDEFNAGSHSQALHQFEAIAVGYPDDKPTQIYIERCHEAIVNPSGAS
jgi:adenylate cyclase